MKCLRCGHCCRRYVVVLPDFTVHLGDGDCKFLTWDGGKAVCTIHGQTFKHNIEGEELTIPWEETPCGQFDQIGHPDANCRVGEAILKRLRNEV